MCNLVPWWKVHSSSASEGETTETAQHSNLRKLCCI